MKKKVSDKQKRIAIIIRVDADIWEKIKAEANKKEWSLAHYVKNVVIERVA